jgi:hypothetical protein
MKQKIQLSKKFGSWWVTVPGAIPDCSRHEHFTDAIAKIHLATRPRMPRPINTAGQEATKRKIRP